MRFRDLPVVVAHYIGAVAVQHADWRVGSEWRGMRAGFNAMSARFDAIKRDRVIVERIEKTDGV